LTVGVPAGHFFCYGRLADAARPGKSHQPCVSKGFNGINRQRFAPDDICGVGQIGWDCPGVEFLVLATSVASNEWAVVAKERAEARRPGGRLSAGLLVPRRPVISHFVICPHRVYTLLECFGQCPATRQSTVKKLIEQSRGAVGDGKLLVY